MAIVLLLLGLAFANQQYVFEADLDSVSTRGQFAHFTDIHLDLYYSPGAKTRHQCHSKPHKYDVSRRAGPLGDSKCDTPLSLLTNALSEMRSATDRYGLDFILWTGDAARHDEDERLPRTFGEIVRTEDEVVRVLQQYFPGKQVVPSIGNNDIYPHNDFHPNIHRNVLNQLAGAWSDFLQDPNALASFRLYGYFAMDAAQFRVISLNTLLFSISNQLVTNCSEPRTAARRHILFIERELALRHGANVIIIGHIAPSQLLYTQECYESYTLLIAKFRHKIVSQHFGHTNMDYFVPSLSLFSAPSIVPTLNSGFRIFQYDVRSSLLIDYHQYLYIPPSSESQHKPSKLYQLTYSFRRAYSVPNLSPVNLERAHSRILAQPRILRAYLKRMTCHNSKWDRRLDQLRFNNGTGSGTGECDDKEPEWMSKKMWTKMRSFLRQ